MKTSLLIIITGIVAIMVVSTIIASPYIFSSDFIKVESVPNDKSSTLSEDQIDSDGDKIPDHFDPVHPTP